MRKSYIIEPGKFEVVTSGFNSTVYLNSDLAIKVPRAILSNDNFDLKKEFQIQKDIFSAGYFVPRPEGVFKVEIKCPEFYDFEHLRRSHQTSMNCDALFMERIHGKDLVEIRSTGLEKNIGKDFDELKYEALIMASSIKTKLGLSPKKYYSLRPRNIMYDFLNRHLVLIDFGDWGRAGEIEKKNPWPFFSR